jgi:hypothetical protein
MADLASLQLAAAMLQLYKGSGPIVVHTTSQAVLQVIDKPSFTSSTALQAAMALDDLSAGCPVPILLIWGIPNANHAPVDRAIGLTMVAASLKPVDGMPVVATSKAYAK